MKKFKRKECSLSIVSLLSFITIVVISVVFRKFFFYDKTGNGISIWLSALEIALMFAALLPTIFQLRDSKEISRASFIIELNKSYVENKDYVNIYNFLQNALDRENECEECKDWSEFNPNDSDLTKSELSNYLTFFETIYILYQRGVISFEIIDDLFAYRFFLAVHSNLFQEVKLVKQPKNFRNIYKLEKEWLEYRDRHKCDANDSIYKTNILKDKTIEKYSEDLYEELTR